MIRHVCIIFVLCLLLSLHTSHTSSAFCGSDVIMGYGRGEGEGDSKGKRMGRKQGCQGKKQFAKNQNSKSGSPCSER